MNKVIKQNTFKVDYSSNSSNEYLLIEADTIPEAYELALNYLNNTCSRPIKITSIQSYLPILKQISKSVTKTVTVEL